MNEDDHALFTHPNLLATSIIPGAGWLLKQLHKSLAYILTKETQSRSPHARNYHHGPAHLPLPSPPGEPASVFSAY